MSGSGEQGPQTAKAAASTPTLAMTSFQEHNHAERLLMWSPRCCQSFNASFEEVAPTLGLSVRETWRRVTIPLIRNGVTVAWVLIFLQTMKELPATLLLRPVGFDTLAIRVWLEASEEYYQLAAPSALLIVLVGLPALAWLLFRDCRAA